MSDLSSRKPRKRPLLWSDTLLDLQETLQSLTDAPLYIVGGAVRDAYLHRPIKDLDLVAPEKAIRLARKLADALEGDVFVMDVERDVARVFVTIQDERLTIDIASFRGETLLEDLWARDFTLNALAVDVHGDMSEFIDPCNGETAMENRLLQRCTEASITDDPLRALRAVRQSVQLHFRIEAETLKDVRHHSKMLPDISPERIRDEFHSLLNLDRVAAALRIAMKVGVLESVIADTGELVELPAPEPGTGSLWEYTLRTLEKLHQILLAISPRRTDETAAVFGLGVMIMQFDRYRTALNAHLNQRYANERSHRAILMLAALLHRHPVANQSGAVAGYAEQLRLSSPEKKRLMTILTGLDAIDRVDVQSSLALHRFWFNVGETGIDILLLRMAAYLAQMHTELQQKDWLLRVERAQILFSTWLEQHDTIVNPPLFVNGHDLMTAFDLKGGRLIGDLLALIREAQVEKGVQSRDEALAFAKDYLDTLN